MAKKKDKPLYDENGRWVEERSRIKGAIRRSFRLSPQMKEVLQAARVELPPALKKDGTPGKRPQVRYRCAICSNLFPQKHVQVDHLLPVVPLWKPEKDMSYDEIVRGVFCSADKLQVVCSTPMKQNDGKPSCHKKKTDEENFIRRKWLEHMEEQGGSDSVDFNWDLSKKGHRDYVNNLQDKWQKEYTEYLKEKEAKRCKRKTRKSKTAKK